MRVPIYAQDLLPKAAFKKLARSITTRWPGQLPIQQTLANEALSKGLGYLDYHEVRIASLTCPPEMPTPSEADVRAGIAAEISSLLKQSNDNSVSPVDLQRYVDALPLRGLAAFKVSGLEALPMVTARHLKLDLSPDHTCPVNDTRPTTETPCYSSPAPVQVHVRTRPKNCQH